MSAKFELEAMRIALGEMLERIGRIEEELELESEFYRGREDFVICGECREAAPGGCNSSKDLSTVSVSPSGAAVL